MNIEWEEIRMSIRCILPLFILVSLTNLVEAQDMEKKKAIRMILRQSQELFKEERYSEALDLL